MADVTHQQSLAPARSEPRPNTVRISRTARAIRRRRLPAFLPPVSQITPGEPGPCSVVCQAGKWLSLLAVVLLPAGAAGLDPSALVGTDIGNPGLVGTTVTSAQLVQITASGAGIGFKSDQFHFAAVPEPGDFDVQVRVSALKNTDLWAKAGVMLRSGTGAEAPFVAVLATPSGAGCMFQTREQVGGNAVNEGFFPANQPFAWLRLRRQGEVMTGYAGYDGRRWTVLGTKTLAFGADAMLGLAVTSHSPQATRAEFRDLGLAQDEVVEPVAVASEPLGPSTRRSALVISEIMYNPADRTDNKDLEFVELYNSQPYFEDISGWRLTGEIDFTFPAGTLLPGGGFLVVARSPEDVRAVYALDQVLGPYTGNLDNNGGDLRLVGEHNAVFLEVDYNDRAPWPELADGAGHSLVLACPSYGEADSRAWAASRIKGGSPGMLDAVEITSSAAIRLNECQFADATGQGFIELFNAGPVMADLSGVRLGRSINSLSFTVPNGILLAPGGFRQFTWAELGFSARATGDRLYVESADQSRFLDAVTFGPQVPGTSAGRWPNGGPSIRSLPRSTPGAANAYPQSDPVISEVHHSPISGASAEEFIELYNGGKTPLDLSSWEFTSGVSFTFPQGTTIPPGGYLVLARDAARLRQLRPSLGPGEVTGDFQGKLDGRGERLVLSRPVTVRAASGQNETVLAAVSEARYVPASRWHHWSDKGGSTLELTDTRADPILAANWADSDETGGGEWATVEFTGVLDNGPAGGGFGGGFGGRPGPGGGGGIAPDSLHIILLGEGECLIDNVEVIGPGGNNRVANGTFEQGITGWTFSGNHIRSSLETTAGDQSNQSLHLRASGNGDTGANKIYVRLTPALTNGNTATLRARVKWLSGWPEVLLRLRGNYLEAYGRLAAPAVPGTPGAVNSRAVANSGPALADVSHFPVVPAATEPVVVTALVDDPDGIASVALRYRADPEASSVVIPMGDDGTAGDAVPGDGIYSAVIPAPNSARLVAFTIEAQDRAANSAVTVFPPGAPHKECLVRFGDGSPSGAFGVYRLWVTQANSESWRNRPVMSNEPVESTFVYGNSRVVYNAGGRFAGSPYHQQFRNGPASDAHFVIELPKDAGVIGTAAFNKLHAPGNGAFDDTALQREQVVYWLARQSGLPWLHRRFFHFYVNGARKRNLMEDTQVGSDDLVEQFWPNDAEGELYKMQPWFEFADATTQTLQMLSSTFVSISRFTTTGNELKLARYRWNWLVRGAESTANDYGNVLQLVNVATDYANPNYEAEVEKLVDVDGWFRYFAINHAVGNWDSMGYRNQQNTYSYKPRQGRWELIIWDANIALGNSNSDGPSNLPLFTTSDPTLTRWFTQGGFRRRFLSAYYNLVNGPFQASAAAPMLDAKYAAFLEHGISASSPEAIKTWITSARSYILSQISKDSAEFAVTSVDDTGTLTLTGTGPLDMVSLEINHTPTPVIWTSTKNWTATFSPAKTESLLVSALDLAGALIPGAEQEITLTPLTALTLQRLDGELIFGCPAPRGGRYQLQAADSLGAPNWQTVATAEAVDGAVQFRLAAPGVPLRFYRVVVP